MHRRGPRPRSGVVEEAFASLASGRYALVRVSCLSRPVAPGGDGGEVWCGLLEVRARMLALRASGFHLVLAAAELWHVGIGGRFDRGVVETCRSLLVSGCGTGIVPRQGGWSGVQGVHALDPGGAGFWLRLRRSRRDQAWAAPRLGEARWGGCSITMWLGWPGAARVREGLLRGRNRS